MQSAKAKTKFPSREGAGVGFKSKRETGSLTSRYFRPQNLKVI
jgi:hypothetical protein